MLSSTSSAPFDICTNNAQGLLCLHKLTTLVLSFSLLFYLRVAVLIGSEPPFLQGMNGDAGWRLVPRLFVGLGWGPLGSPAFRLPCPPQGVVLGVARGLPESPRPPSSP